MALTFCGDLGMFLIWLRHNRLSGSLYELSWHLNDDQDWDYLCCPFRIGIMGEIV